MGRETTLFSSEERKDRAEVCSFLRALADRLETGSVTLQQDKGELSLEVPEQLILEIKVEDEEKSGGIQHSLEVELKWGAGIGSAGGLKLG